MKEYICTHEQAFGKGLTLSSFYEVEEVEVEFKIEKKSVVSKISKKSFGED